MAASGIAIAVVTTLVMALRFLHWNRGEVTWPVAWLL